VIPAYNEEARISATLERVISYLEGRSYSWEVLVADDGSSDGTAALVAEVAASQPNLRLMSLSHRGKGWAVKNGMMAARGEYRVLCDADLSVPIEQVERLLPPQVQGVDIALGSRAAKGAQRIGEPSHRHLMGRIYNALVRTIAVAGIQDTQCGFKCYRGEVVPCLFQRQTMDGFAFDVEVLFLARKAGMLIREVAVDWYYQERSTVRAFRDSFSMTLDLITIRWRHRKRKHKISSN